MGRTRPGNEYQIIALRANGQREPIAVGIPARQAKLLLRSMADDGQFANLRIEPMAQSPACPTPSQADAGPDDEFDDLMC